MYNLCIMCIYCTLTLFNVIYWFDYKGRDMLIGKAQNKGGVGVPLQIHDTSIGIALVINNNYH